MADTELIQPPNPMSLIELGIKERMTPEAIAKLVELQMEMAKHHAAERFGQAMADVQAECPPIHKSKTAGMGQYAFSYAPYEEVVRTVGPILSKHGVSYSFTVPEYKDGLIQGTMRIRVGSHYEDKAMSMPVPTQVKVNDSQRMGQAVSYFKRQLLVAGFGLVCTDEDNDAADLHDTISANEVDTLAEWIVRCKEAGKPVDMAKFLAVFEVSALDEMKPQDFAKALDMLKRKAGTK